MNMPYVHLLQFRCRGCDQPIVIFIGGEAANLEKVDSDPYRLECDCGWSETLIGVEAARHLVIPVHHEEQINERLQGSRNEEDSDST
jgi:hypothetical protein